MADEVYRRIVPTSHIISLMRKDTFPEGMGETISNLTYERTAPTDAVPTWNDVVSSLPQQGCLPTPDTIVFGSTARNWNLQNRSVNGPDFCVENLRTKFALEKQLSSLAKIMADYARVEWEIRYRTEYIRLTGTKVVAGGSNPGTVGTGSTFPGTVATSQLTQGMLDYWRMMLLREGAAESSLGNEDGVPILTLVTSPETSNSLIFQNADMRQDIRWGKPSLLLAPFGVNRSYKGFYHLNDLFAKRYAFSGGAYSEIPAWVNTAASVGTKSILSSTWLGAFYEASYIFDPMVMTSRIPKPIGNAGSGFKFNPVNYMGDFAMLNILDKVCNPRGTILFPNAIFASASEPVAPERGVALVHMRCDSAANAILSCT